MKKLFVKYFIALILILFALNILISTLLFYSIDNGIIIHKSHNQLNSMVGYNDKTTQNNILSDELSNGNENIISINSKERGISCQITVSIKGDKKGTIYGTAKNAFTLGSSIIPVYIVLWSSESKNGISINNLPEASNYIGDLNIFKSIECSKGTGGKAKYWQAYVFWNFDNKGWEYGSTQVMYYDANAVLQK